MAMVRRFCLISPSAQRLLSCFSMEQHFLGTVKQAWDSAEVAPDPRSLAVLSLDAGGPWPLPCYLVQGEFSVDNCDFDWERLSSPVGGGRRVHQQNGFRRSPELLGTNQSLEAATQETGGSGRWRGVCGRAQRTPGFR
ncbi:hypothetical protein H1C71_004695 [Ictidomys tridecemlineatus]|nr:hypothetical protein H1C71_004695 [Ictidomys tridecemlineatus]